MYKRILVPLDGSDPSRQALHAAVQLAAERGGRLCFVHVFDEIPYVTGYEYREYGPDLVALARRRADRLLTEALQQAQAAGLEAETRIVEASAHRLGEAIAHQARLWNAELLVVGSHGRRGIGRALLGSGAEQVVRLAPVPVLVVRAQQSLAGAGAADAEMTMDAAPAKA